MQRTVIDLFSGAGGLSLGLKEAGFETVLAVENNPDACATYRAALPHVNLHEGDIRKLDFRHWQGVDLVAGGPPCQPFSIGGLRRGHEDERDLLPEFVRAVLEVRPRAFLLENVPGLGSANLSGYLRERISPLAREYQISEPVVINAADYGVPQSRRRLIVVGMAGGEVAIPDGDPEHALASGDVLTPAPRGFPNSAKIIYAKNPDLRPSPYHGQLFNGGGRPINLEAPAPTILASAGGNKTHFLDIGGRVPPYHSYLKMGGRPFTGELPEARRLTVHECALLQTFPHSMEFIGPRSSQHMQIGNAVPPRLASVLGGAVIDRLPRPIKRQACAA